MVAFAPILSRLYGPEEFAQYALFAVFTNLAAVFATGRYEFALMLPEREEDARNLLALAMLLPVAVTCVLGMGVGVYVVLVSGGTTFWLWLVPPSTLTLAWYFVAARWQARKRRFRLIAYAEIVASSIALAIQLGVGAASDLPSGLPLILGQFFGRAASLVVLCWGMRPDWAARTLQPRSYGLVATALHYRHFPLFSCGASLLGKANQELPKLLLAALFGPQVLGLYSLTTRVLGTPSSLIGQAFGDAFFPRISEYRGDRNRAQRLLLKACCYLTVLILPPTVVLFLWGDWMFAVVFGPEWAMSGVYARLLIPLFVAQFVVQPIALSMHAFEKQHAVLVWQCCSMLILLAAFSVGKLFADVEAALFSYGLASASMLTIYLAMSLHYASQLGIANADSKMPDGIVHESVSHAA